MFGELKASYQPLDRPKIHGFTLNIDCFLNGRNFDFVDQRVINRILSTLTLNRPVILSTSMDIEDLECVITQRLEDLLTYRNGSYVAKNLFAICQNGSAIYSFKFDTAQKILTPLIDEQIHTDASSALRFIAINFLENTNLDLVARFEPESQEPQNENKILKQSLDFEVKDCIEIAEILGNYNISPNVVLPRETFLDTRNTRTLQELYSQTAQESRVLFRKGLDLLKDEATQTFQIGRPEFLDTIRFSLDGGIEHYFEELNLTEESAFYCFVNQVSYLNPNKRRYFLNYGSEKLNHKHWYSRAEGYYLTESKAVGDLPTIKKYKWLSESAIDLLRMVSKIQGLFVENYNINQRDWKLGLSFYDNLRTQLLHIFHSYSYLKTLGHLQDNKLNEKLRNICEYFNRSYYNVLELKNILPQDPRSFENFVECIISATLEVNQILELNTSDKIVQKSVRGIIEADSPLQVDVFSLFLAEEIIRSGIKKVSLVGLHFGGSELPFAVKRRINNLDKTIDVQMVSAHYSYYSNRDLSYKNGFLDAQIWKDVDKVYLLDDGVFTGSSISKIHDEISRLGFNVTSRVMQIANSRRFGHMQKTGGIDTQYLNAEIAPSAVGVTPSVIIKTLEDFEKQAGTFNSKLIQVSIARRMKSYYEI